VTAYAVSAYDLTYERCRSGLARLVHTQQKLGSVRHRTRCFASRSPRGATCSRPAPRQDAAWNTGIAACCESTFLPLSSIEGRPPTGHRPTGAIGGDGALMPITAGPRSRAGIFFMHETRAPIARAHKLRSR
jgi:hypothetical protein